MKQQIKQEQVLDQIILKTLGVEVHQLDKAVQGQEQRRKRRVAVWAYSAYLGWEEGHLQNRFGIQSRQQIQKILRSKVLPEDEYNWRRLIDGSWKQNQRSPIERMIS